MKIFRKQGPRLLVQMTCKCIHCQSNEYLATPETRMLSNL